MSDQLLVQTKLLPATYTGSDIQVYSAWATFSETSHFNLAGHTGADPQSVQAARELLQSQLSIDSLTWLDQQHTISVVEFSQGSHFKSGELIADASVTTVAGQACAVLTADCVPVLLVDPHEPQIAAIHAGWRGLANGIIEETLKTFSQPDKVHAYIGPCISQQHFEVEQGVLNYFEARLVHASKYFLPAAYDSGKWFANLPGLTAQTLRDLGVLPEFIKQSGLCTYSDSRFPSYRLNKTACRMASMVWFK